MTEIVDNGVEHVEMEMDWLRVTLNGWEPGRCPRRSLTGTLGKRGVKRLVGRLLGLLPSLSLTVRMGKAG